MKNIFLATLTIISMISLGCAKGNDSGQPPLQQTTTMNTDCVTYPQNCNSTYYNNSNGFQPYNYNNSNYYNSGYNNYDYNSGYAYGTGYGSGYRSGYGYGSASNYYNNTASSLCNCPQGSMPTYNTYAGMGCVNSGLINNNGYSGYAYFSWGTGSNNNQWMNIPQVSNYVGYGSQSCYNGVVQSCLTDQQNMCGIGYTCRASSAGSRMGLCVSNSAASSGQIYR